MPFEQHERGIQTPETTTLRAELPDPAALSGLVERIVGLGLEIMDVRLLTRPSVP